MDEAPVDSASTARVTAFKDLLDAMLHGAGTRDTVARLKSYIDDARAEDLVEAVDRAVANGTDFSVLKSAVSKFVNLLYSSLSKRRFVSAPEERFLSSLSAENTGLIAVLERGKSAAKAINAAFGEAVRQEAPQSDEALSAIAGLRAVAVELGAVETHYRKKENILFPWFEARYPRYRCVRLMWEIQDDARHGLKELGAELDRARDIIEKGEPYKLAALNRILGRLYFDINANVIREEVALFPVIAPLLSRADSESLLRESLDYGFAFLDQAAVEEFTVDMDVAKRVQPEPQAEQGALAGLAGRTGAVPAEILAAVFGVLPVDMTWVDADDKVRWFSDGRHRIFPRSPAIIGRDVRNCHPGSSVDRVVAILEAFRSGSKDSESFWIELGGKFISIEYFALRGPNGEYLGTLEASQDLTEKRALSGEKRLASSN